MSLLRANGKLAKQSARWRKNKARMQTNKKEALWRSVASAHLRNLLCAFNYVALNAISDDVLH